MTEKRLRAVRGAITVPVDARDEILASTRELLATMLHRNALDPDDIVSAIFTVTADLRSEFPARAARDLGWRDVPLLCTVEIAVPGALPRCIRVLLHAETMRAKAQIRHVYLGGASILRPDLLSD